MWADRFSEHQNVEDVIMLFQNFKKLAITGLLIIPLSACYSPDNDRRVSTVETRDVDRRVGEVRGNDLNCLDCGYVADIDEVAVDGESTGLGAVIGAVVGGIAGNQVGGGRGNDIATAAGAVGGAVAGNEIEKTRGTDLAYEVLVDMDNGGDRIVTVSDLSGLDIGSYVEIDGSDLIVR